MTIGKQIRYVRKHLGLTQKELGRLSGTSETTIKQYEAEKRQPRIEQLQKIAYALGGSVSDIFLLDNEELNEEDFLKAYATSLQQFHGKIVEKAQEEENELLYNYRQLNTDGRTEARKRVSELTEIKRYTEKEEAPEEPTENQHDK